MKFFSLLLLFIVVLTSCTPPRVYTSLNEVDDSKIDSVQIYSTIGNTLSSVRRDILIELKSQFYFNGIKSLVFDYDSTFTAPTNEPGFVLIISEMKESRRPLFLDFGIKSGWAWPGSILGRSFRFRADLIHEGKSIWVGDVYSSYDRLFADKVVGEGISRRFLKGMQEDNLLPDRFSFVKYALKYQTEEELYNDTR